MTSPTAVRVLTYNIRHGQGVGGLVSNPRIARVIRGIAPDVAGLTEVWRIGSRYDQPSLLGGLTDMHDEFHAVHAGMGREIGNLALTPVAPSARRQVDLGGKRERRGCLLLDVEVRGRVFVFGVVHLSLDATTRAQQVARLVEELPADRPFVLVGDFNCEVPGLGLLRESLTFPEEVPATYPSPLPFRRLDHIGYSRHWRLESLQAHPSWASDHRPLSAELVLVT